MLKHRSICVTASCYVKVPFQRRCTVVVRVLSLLLFFLVQALYSHAAFKESVVGEKFCFDGTNKGHRLQAITLRSVYAFSEIDCILLCLRDECCRSANYRVQQNYDGTENCELLHAVVEDLTAEEFVTRNEYDYLRLLQPNRNFTCDCSPCKYNGSCPNVNLMECSFSLIKYPCLGSAFIPELNRSNYIRSDGGPEMSGITLCFSVKILQKGSSDPHYVSYAVQDESNEILIGGDTSLFFMVQDERKETSAATALPKDTWHSVCMTWENTSGNYSIYINGSQKANGAGLKVGKTIRGGGIWILGHDQDNFGGRLDSRQMLGGEIADVNIWDRVLSPDEVAWASSTCNATLKGNVKSWKDFEKGLHGNVVIKDYPSCCFYK